MAHASTANLYLPVSGEAILSSLKEAVSDILPEVKRLAIRVKNFTVIEVRAYSTPPPHEPMKLNPEQEACLMATILEACDKGGSGVYSIDLAALYNATAENDFLTFY